ncbi:MAG: hypothetical protein ACLRSE_05340 [Alistipes finegoldii]
MQNLWYDFGLGEGGTLRTLVMRLERCDSREAIRRLQNGEKGTPVPFLFTGCWRASRLPEVPCRSCVRPPSPRSGSSPTLRFVIRHWSVISLRAASSRLLPRHSAARFATR